MKHLIILGDGMADWPCNELKGKTLLQYADTPHFDWLAKHGRNGLLKTVPDGFHPGSEVANSSSLGYDQHIVYEGRGPLEAASIGVELAEDDLALTSIQVFSTDTCWSSRVATSICIARRLMIFP